MANNIADLILSAGQVVTCGDGSRPRAGSKMEDLGIISDGAVVIKDGLIATVGSKDEILRNWSGVHGDFPNQCLTPGLVDPHCHPIFGGSRVKEFYMRAQGASYQQIHDAGGGIFSTVRATRQASDAELLTSCVKRMQRALDHGTTTLEAKSGYGLSLAEELRELELIALAGEQTELDVVATFLGAHAIDPDYSQRRAEFVELICKEMVPAVAAQGIAKFGDVFCEEGAFTREESQQVLQACKEAGLGLRIHAEEFTYQGGARMAAELGATSCDHLQFLPESDFEVLRQNGTIPVMTAGTSFFLGMKQFAPAKAMIEADLPVALGTDFNAGSNLSISMPMAMYLVISQMKLSPAQAIIAATVNAAHSLKVGHLVGSLEVGKQADLLVVDVENIEEWPYQYGVNLVQAVYKRGRLAKRAIR
jgi:imidazolonepropionase